MQIRTNELSYELNKDALFGKYTILKCETTDKYIKYGARVLDCPQLDKSVEAVRFTGGRSFYVLMNQRVDAVRSYKKLIEDTEEWKSLTVSEVRANDVSDDVLLQLLINAVYNYNPEPLKFSNLTGHFYMVNYGLIKKGKIKGVEEIKKIPTLEISITKDMRLALNVRTFTSELLKTKIKFTRMKFEQYPKYVLDNGVLRREVLSDKDKKLRRYILRQVEGEKSKIAFLDISNLPTFYKSKMGMLLNLVEAFNKKYTGIAKIDFKMLDVSSAINHKTSDNNFEKEIIAKNLADTKFRIIDATGDGSGEVLANQMIEIFENKYNLKLTVGKRLTSDAYNIRIIHNKDYYAGVDDVHSTYVDKAVQHITVENYVGVAKTAVDAVIYEVMIKKDLLDGKISLYDWTRFEFDGDIKFGVCRKVGDITKYFFMCIHPDGSFEIKEQESNLFKNDEYNRLADIFLDMYNLGKPIRGIVEDDKGQINVIRDDEYFTIPNIWKIENDLKSNHKIPRGDKFRDEYFSSVNDIRYVDMGEYALYFVGVIGHGMNRTIRNASLIRRVEPYGGSEIFFEKLLPLMNVTFVRNGQLTVVPFPFKYLNEYLNSNL